MRILASLLLVFATAAASASDTGAAPAAAPAPGDGGGAARSTALVEPRAVASATALPPVVVLAGGLAPSWRGIPADEATGMQGPSMLYPAPSAGGLLAAILTHAVIVGGARESARQARQEEADRVLQPHAGAIARLTAERVAQATAALMAMRPTGRAAAGRVLEVRPSFAVSPDQRVLVLDSAVKIAARDPAAAAEFEGIVRVVSSPRLEAEPQAAWAADEGRLLEQEALAMLAHSLELALSFSNRPAAPTSARTQRYAHGATERMERGELLASGCGRVVLRTLRDWLMSVPLATTATAREAPGQPACAGAYALAPAAP